MQIEVQLGHLCNNRCVFCVSGQLSEQKRAPQLPPEPIRRQIAEARAQGAERITFLGGEPTMQRAFLDLLRYAVTLDFPEIVLFTNGTMTPRESFRERVQGVLAELGPDVQRRVLWRFSLQGGTREAHDATTVNPGAWDRILRSIEILHGEGARLTGNLCVVESNWRSVPELAEIVQRFQFENLHLDMIRPRDSGDRTDDWLRSIMARYTDMAPAFVELDRRLPAGFDLNFGNVPYCTMPEVSHRIHHDGLKTVTVAADGQGHTQEGFNKYEDKRTDKHKPDSCRECAFDASCSGVFDKYRQFYGDSEFVPVSPEALWRRDTAGHHFVLLAAPLLRNVAMRGLVNVLREDERAGEIDVESNGWRMILRRPGRSSTRQGWLTLAGERFEAVLVGAPANGLAAVLQRLAKVIGGRPPAATELEVRSAWQRHRQLTLLVEQLRAQPLDGWQATEVVRSAQAAEVWWRGVHGTLTLTVQLPPGEQRPRFGHSAEGVPAAVVAAFSRALGERLKGLAGASSQT
jgi:MoaA/NifB/PqqE/SkfB family radical SAM enzyme